MPRAYWEIRQDDPAKAQELIGGKGFTVKKVDGQGWMVAKGGEKVETDNPADHYNTVLKMAKKRALVDAVLTTTAASDIFTQDLEEISASIATLAPPAPAPSATPSASTVSSPSPVSGGRSADADRSGELSPDDDPLRQEPGHDLGGPDAAATPLVRSRMAPQERSAGCP